MTTWTIKEMERNLSDGGVIRVHWNAAKEEGEYSTDTWGNVIFTPNPSASDFIAYEDLTQDTVLQWVWAHEDVNKSDIEDMVDAQLNAEKAAPTQAFGVPW